MSIKSQNRKRLIRVYGTLYKRASVDLTICAYCGEDRACLDHVPPISWIETIDLKKFRKNKNEFLLYPCCSQCNGYLGDKPYFTYKERLSYLYDRYIKEIERIKGLWSEEEIQEMSSMFQKMIRARQGTIRELIRRHRNIESRMIDE